MNQEKKYQSTLLVSVHTKNDGFAVKEENRDADLEYLIGTISEMRPFLSRDYIESMIERGNSFAKMIKFETCYIGLQLTWKEVKE